jgi:hypothetical protein
MSIMPGAPNPPTLDKQQDIDLDSHLDILRTDFTMERNLRFSLQKLRTECATYGRRREAVGRDRALLGDVSRLMNPLTVKADSYQ